MAGEHEGLHELPPYVRALEVLDRPETAFELVISDVRMPRVGGALLEQRLRERFPELPVLLISGYHEEQLSRDHDTSQVRFLPKPFLPSELLREVRSILG